MVKEIAQMGLVQRLDTLDTNVGRISDERFDKLRHYGNVVSRDSLITMQRSVNMLRGLVEQDILPSIEEDNGTFEVDFDDKGP